jgi:hypothetical protein
MTGMEALQRTKPLPDAPKPSSLRAKRGNPCVVWVAAVVLASQCVFSRFGRVRPLNAKNPAPHNACPIG